ncbi:12744_t:CDS:2, partial [Entrophospora sp. SA101]
VNPKWWIVAIRMVYSVIRLEIQLHRERENTDIENDLIYTGNNDALNKY